MVNMGEKKREVTRNELQVGEQVKVVGRRRTRGELGVGEAAPAWSHTGEEDFKSEPVKSSSSGVASLWAIW